MGVLGWTYDQTLDTPMPAIKAAINARNKRDNYLLKTIGSFFDVKFVEDAPAAPATPSRKLSPKLFDALFAGKK